MYLFLNLISIIIVVIVSSVFAVSVVFRIVWFGVGEGVSIGDDGDVAGGVFPVRDVVVVVCRVVVSRGWTRH